MWRRILGLEGSLRLGVGVGETADFAGEAGAGLRKGEKKGGTIWADSPGKPLL